MPAILSIDILTGLDLESTGHAVLEITPNQGGGPEPSLHHVFINDAHQIWKNEKG